MLLRHSCGAGNSEEASEPMVNVGQADTVAFCEWASRQGQGCIRLPGKAKCEEATRGRVERPFLL